MDQMLLQIMLRALARDHLEVLVETGEVVEAALVAKLLDADAVVYQQPAGMSYPDLRHKLGIGLAGPGFEIPAEGVRGQTGHSGYISQVDLPGEVAEGVVIDGVDPVVLQFRIIRLEPDGREQVRMLGGCKCRKAFYQGYNAGDPLGRTYLFHQLRDPGFFPCIDQDASPGLVQQYTDRLGLRKLKEGVAPEIFRKMDHRGMDRRFLLSTEIHIIVSPEMG